MRKMFKSVILGFIIKINALTLFLGSMLCYVTSFIMPIWNFLFLTFCMIIADLVTGIIAAKNRKEEISSKGMKRTVAKFLLYGMAILASRGIVIVFLPEEFNGSMHFTWLVSGTICLTEIKSLFENVEEVTGVNLLARIDFLEKIFGNKEEKIEKKSEK